MLSMQPRLRFLRRRRRAKTDRIETASLCFARCSLHKRGEPRGLLNRFAAPTPEDEDRRRICRERKVLIMERVQHVNRIKGLLFSQGASAYEPLRSRSASAAGSAPDRRWPSPPPHLKAQVCRELDRFELLLEQESRLWRPSETRCSTQNKPKRRPRHRCGCVAWVGAGWRRWAGVRSVGYGSEGAVKTPRATLAPRRLGRRGGEAREGGLANRAEGV